MVCLLGPLPAVVQMTCPHVRASPSTIRPSNTCCAPGVSASTLAPQSRRRTQGHAHQLLAVALLVAKPQLPHALRLLAAVRWEHAEAALRTGRAARTCGKLSIARELEAGGSACARRDAGALGQCSRLTGGGQAGRAQGGHTPAAAAPSCPEPAQAQANLSHQHHCQPNGIEHRPGDSPLGPPAGLYLFWLLSACEHAGLVVRATVRPRLLLGSGTTGPAPRSYSSCSGRLSASPSVRTKPRPAPRRGPAKGWPQTLLPMPASLPIPPAVLQLPANPLQPAWSGHQLQNNQS